MKIIRMLYITSYTINNNPLILYIKYCRTIIIFKIRSHSIHSLKCIFKYSEYLRVKSTS